MARQMKDSGVVWIGKMPENWKLTKLKNIIQFINGYAFNSEDLKTEGLYPVIRIGDISNGKIDLINANKVDLENDMLNNYIIQSKDTLIAMSGATVGKLGYCDYIDNKAYINQRVGIIRASNKFVYYYLGTEEFLKYILLLSVGSAQPNISTEGINNYYISLPPEDEQQKIVDFLDEKVGEIDNVIETTKATIEDYKKYKQSLITEAVTKGLNPDVEMKDSGIEWIGEIPEHWEIVPLKHKCILNAETLTEQTDQEYEFNYVEIGSVSLSDGIKEYERTVFKNAPSRARRVAKKDDIIISTVRTYLKAIAVVPEKDDVIVSTGFAVLTPNKIVPSFLGYFLKTDYFTNTVTAHSTGVSYPAINSSELVSFKILVPTEAEQEEIANYLDEKCTEIDNLISAKEKLVEDMENYKKSLIYEYVTGKKEVSDNE